MSEAKLYSHIIIYYHQKTRTSWSQNYARILSPSLYNAIIYKAVCVVQNHMHSINGKIPNHTDLYRATTTECNNSESPQFGQRNIECNIIAFSRVEDGIYMHVCSQQLPTIPTPSLCYDCFTLLMKPGSIQEHKTAQGLTMHSIHEPTCI